MHPDHGPKKAAKNLEAGLLNLELRSHFWVRNLAPLIVYIYILYIVCIYIYKFHCTFHQSCVFSSTAKPRPTELDTHEANVQWVSFSLISIIQCATQGFPCFREENACPHNWRCFATTSSNVVNHRCYLRHFDHL